MKRLATALLFLACLAAIARAQSLPVGLIAEPVKPFAAIVEGPQPQRFDLADSTPEARADLVRWLVTQLKSGTTLKLAPLEYNFGGTVFKLPSGIPIVGAGKGKTVWISTQEDQRHYCGFEIVGRGVSLSDMTLIWKSKDGLTRGGQTLGIADPSNPGNTVAKFRNLEVVSYGSCALYVWGGGKGHRARFDGCDFRAGRWSGCIGAGSGDDSAILEFNRCGFVANFAELGGAGGDMGTPPNTTGFVIRGGQATLTDCTADVTGFPGTGKPNDPSGPPFKLAVGFACSSIGDPRLPTYTYKWPYMTLTRCTANVKANGAEKAIDVWGHIGTTKAIDCKGSGVDGALITDGNVETTKQDKRMPENTEFSRG